MWPRSTARRHSRHRQPFPPHQHEPTTLEVGGLDLRQARVVHELVGLTCQPEPEAVAEGEQDVLVGGWAECVVGHG